MTKAERKGNVMAKALIGGDEYGDLALRYYARFPDEPTSYGKAISVEQPQLVKKMSLDNLLTAIIDSWAKKTFVGSDLVVVTHGNSRGLIMRLFPDHKTDSRSDVLETLLSNSAANVIAKKLFITEEQTALLLDKIHKVRKLSLGAVEFRGCLIGNQERNIRILKEMFESVSVCGPFLLSTYGGVPMVEILNKKQMDVWIKKRKGPHVYDSLKGRFALDFIGEGTRNKNYAAAESRDVLPEWIAEKMSKTAPKNFEGWMERNVPIHYMQVSSNVPPIMPLEADYKANLVLVR